MSGSCRFVQDFLNPEQDQNGNLDSSSAYSTRNRDVVSCMHGPFGSFQNSGNTRIFIIYMCHLNFQLMWDPTGVTCQSGSQIGSWGLCLMQLGGAP